ncbi:MAG: protein translocase subunit SecF [Thermodesulfobacteriota bacterium]
MNILGITSFNFLGKRKYAFFFSAVLILLGLWACVKILLGTANLGVDFTGGTAIQLRFEKPVKIDAARSLLSEKLGQDADLQEFPLENKLLIRLKGVEGDLGAMSDKIIVLFREDFSDNKFTIDSTTEIGPTVGKRLQKDAILAISIALIGILIYIAVRFELRFGVAAVAATFHDVLAVLGVLSLMGKEVNLLIITALLTVAGYSLNDTVVIFDRIRENLRSKIKAPLDKTINKSINEVLQRTIITSVTTIFVLIALMVAGGEVIHDFALALFIGVLIGTYSSIFIASPVLFLWKGKKGKLIKI